MTIYIAALMSLTAVLLIIAICAEKDPANEPCEPFQCAGAVYNGSLSAPERCVLQAGHDGRCQL